MISLAEARALITQKISPLPAQPASLAMEHGRRLREDICADEDMPAFDRSAMDGYAVGLEDDSKQFRIVGEIQPGAVPKFQINRGECARIFTGAQIPVGASQVLMQENVRVEGGNIIPAQRGQATHIRKRGEDARKGDLLLRSGTRLGAGELALLASLGVVGPKVSPPVRVAHFVTGNELVEPSVKPGPGRIRDSNSTLVAALIRQFGGEISRQENVADEFNVLLEKVRAGEDNFDLLLVSGGASVGDYDFGKKLLGALGFQIHFEQLNLRPGKPLVFATRDNQAAFILPGNPVSHFVTMHVAVRLALQRFTGAGAVWPIVNVRLAESFNHRPDPRETFWPAQVGIQNGELVVRALRWQSSGDVTGLTGANALLQLGANISSPKAGEAVPVLMLEVP
ncbi:MAG TPA: molybdopterin molybdotransferase MoeA [Candidatus Acidoferrales bacterium]|jgi:molybdopterin molybdotransferase|nr:molybdopterin molybdotransferase MoeA [Candidatus Acidoferrales bacterium]